MQKKAGQEKKTVKLVKDKVVKLRSKNEAVELVLRDALAHAHEIESVIVIEVRKKDCGSGHRFSFSKTRHDTLAWAMNLAQSKAGRIIYNPQS